MVYAQEYGDCYAINFDIDDVRTFINNIIKNPNVIDVVFINNSKFLDDNLGRQDTITSGVTEIVINNSHIDKCYFVPSYYINGSEFACSLHISTNNILASLETFNITIDNITFDNNHNTQLRQPFTIKNIPALLDENYIRVKFGEKMHYTTYPLYQLKAVELQTFDYYDFASFSRIYNFNQDEYTQYGTDMDVFDTKIVVNTLENLDMYTDAWLQYKSTNYATLRSGIKNNIAFDILGTMTGSINSSRGFNSADIMSITKNQMIETGMNYSRFGVNNPLLTGINIGLKSAKSVNDFLVNKENLEHTPDKRNLGNQYSSDFLGEFTNVFKSTECVSDIYDVAKKYEFYGYKVNKILNNTNLLNDRNVLTRYYYNYIKCKDIEIDIEYFICDTSIKEDIENRFMQGIRLWNSNTVDNVNYPIGYTVRYDNLEKDFIE